MAAEQFADRVGARRAATSAGDLIFDPATQLTTATRTTSARRRKRVKIRFLSMITSTPGQLPVNPVFNRIDDSGLAVKDDYGYGALKPLQLFKSS